MVNYYKVLNVSSNASQKEIKAAYRKLALIYHPDICSKTNTCDNQKWQEIINAYEELTKPKIFENDRNNQNNTYRKWKTYDYSYDEEKIKKLRIETTALFTIFLVISIIGSIYALWTIVTYILNNKKSKSIKFDSNIFGIILSLILYCIYIIYILYNVLTLDDIIEVFNYYFME